MTWTLATKGNLFYFQEDALRGIDRDEWKNFKDKLREIDDPRKFAIVSCPDHEHKVVLQVPNTDYFLLTYIHDSTFLHPEFGKCIIFVKLGKKSIF